jgi:hypothetical protein
MCIEVSNSCEYQYLVCRGLSYRYRSSVKVSRPEQGDQSHQDDLDRCKTRRRRQAHSDVAAILLQRKDSSNVKGRFDNSNHGQNMQALPFVRAPVPSHAVLNFLRIQAECLPFLASHSQVRRNHHHATPHTARTHILTNSQCRTSLRVVERPTQGSSCRGFWNTATNLRWQKPWQQARPKKTAPLQPNDLPPLPRLLDDAGAASLGRIVKPTNELRMRCTEFDGDGKVTLVNGAFKKSELIAKVQSTITVI